MTQELRDFIEWLNGRTDLILDPVSDLDPDEVVSSYLASPFHFDDLARFLYEHPNCGDSDGPWSPSRQEFYRRLASDIVEWAATEWVEDDDVLVSISDLNALIDWACWAGAQLFAMGVLKTCQPGPQTRRLIEAIEVAES